MEHLQETRVKKLEAPETFDSTQPAELSGFGFHPFLQLQQRVGNRAVQRLLAHRDVAVQAKVIVGAAHDPYELEADRVAQLVMRMPISTSVVASQTSAQRDNPEKDPAMQTKRLADTIAPLLQRAPSDQLPAQGYLLHRKCVCGGTPGADGVCEECRKTGSFEPGADFEARLSADADGSPLPASTRAFMEPRFGADFSGIRLHTGNEAAQLNRALGAQAFTQGQNIYLGEGKENLESSAGKQLLAHELTHSVQQGAALQRTPDPPKQTPADETPDDDSETVPGDLLQPPGDCTYAQNKALHDEVHRVCHGQKGCTGNDDCPTLWEKIGKFADCIRARTIANATCYRGGNRGHIIALASAVGAMANCWALYERKRCQESKPIETPVPVEVEKPKPVYDKSFLDKMAAITGLTGAALIAYLIVSEGSRLFPPRNLIPIP